MKRQQVYSVLQVHFDACFKTKHLAKAGRRSKELEQKLDDAIERTVFISDAERDRRDADIAADLRVAPAAAAAKTCNDFRADGLDSKCEPIDKLDVVP
jgi:hypothetical protein